MFRWDARPPANMEVCHLIEKRHFSICDLLITDYPHVAFELKLKEIICDFGSTLTGEHKHLIPADSDREVTARRRNLPTLVNLVETKSEERT